MEVAEQIVVLNDGRVEQAGPPRDLYENPANEFVMGFVGPVNRLGDEFIRPHDIAVTLEPTPGATEAQIDHVSHLGFEVKVELTLETGRELWVQLTRDEADSLELARGQIVWLRPSRSTSFRGRAGGLKTDGPARREASDRPEEPAASA